jgi:hypothetical protein
MSVSEGDCCCQGSIGAHQRSRGGDVSVCTTLLGRGKELAIAIALLKRFRMVSACRYVITFAAGFTASARRSRRPWGYFSVRLSRGTPTNRLCRGLAAPSQFWGARSSAPCKYPKNLNEEGHPASRYFTGRIQHLRGTWELQSFSWSTPLSGERAEDASAASILAAPAAGLPLPEQPTVLRGEAKRACPASFATERNRLSFPVLLNAILMHLEVHRAIAVLVRDSPRTSDSWRRSRVSSLGLPNLSR